MHKYYADSNHATTDSMKLGLPAHITRPFRDINSSKTKNAIILEHDLYAKRVGDLPTLILTCCELA